MTDINNDTEWQHYNETLRFIFDGYRPGWRGVWDHAKEIALRRNPRLISHDRPVSISLWVRGVAHLDDLRLRMEQPL